MEKRFYEKALHRPCAEILVGFTREDYEQALIAISQATAYMLARMIGGDGLTDKDRILIDYAKKTIFDWRAILKRFEEAETELARKILRQEIERVYDNDKRRRKLQYNE